MLLAFLILIYPIACMLDGYNEDESQWWKDNAP